MKKILIIILATGLFSCASYVKISESEFPYSGNRYVPTNVGTYAIEPIVYQPYNGGEHLTMLPAMIVLLITYWYVEFKRFSKKIDDEYKKQNEE